ncbi:flagellar biosynthetic protein FliR [Limnochorda pilosa]|uniref:Flagellar biosynthetic protein FliR n=1 Tax=Limnochorda pilosa TaxID=1555112 RepID=A0A0K2SK90_LIMPI|nr:flagellar biosynthetic protein FliR [Limnochorda pilosa]BAS27515.1 flagellar biosynthesis protein FliR [Limnochorda pilosa]
MNLSLELGPQIWTLLALLVRVGVLVFFFPVGTNRVPVPVRLGLSGWLAFALWPAVPPESWLTPGAGYPLALAREALVGLGIALVMQLLTGAVQLAGQMVDMPMGFGVVNLLDPQTGQQVPVVAQLFGIVALLLFFVLGGPGVVMAALRQSLVWIPVGTAAVTERTARLLVAESAGVFTTGLRLALPVIAAGFLADVSLGVLSRAVPQFNVFIEGFPIKIGLGLLVLLAGVPFYLEAIGRLVGAAGRFPELLAQMLRTLGP